MKENELIGQKRRLYSEYYTERILELLENNDFVYVDISQGSGIEVSIPMSLEGKVVCCSNRKSVAESFSQISSIFGYGCRYLTNSWFLNDIVKGKKFDIDVLILNLKDDDMDALTILKSIQIMALEDKKPPKVICIAYEIPSGMDLGKSILYKIEEDDTCFCSHLNTNINDFDKICKYILDSHIENTNTLVYCESEDNAEIVFEILERKRSKNVYLINSCIGISTYSALKAYEGNTIILTTNLNESCVIFPIRSVIDMPRTNRIGCTYTGGISESIVNVNELDSYNRKIRCGRDSNGFCHRLYPKSFLYNKTKSCIKTSYVSSVLSLSEYMHNRNPLIEYDNAADKLQYISKMGRNTCKILSKCIEKNLDPYSSIVLCSLIDRYYKYIFMFPLAKEGMTPLEHSIMLTKHQGLISKFRGYDCLETVCNIWMEMGFGAIPTTKSLTSFSSKYGIDSVYLNNVRDLVLNMMSKLELNALRQKETPKDIINDFREICKEIFASSVLYKVDSLVGGHIFENEYGEAFELDPLFPIESSDILSIIPLSFHKDQVTMWILNEVWKKEQIIRYTFVSGRLVAF